MPAVWLLLLLLAIPHSVSADEYCKDYQHQQTLIDSDLRLCWSLSNNDTLRVKAIHPSKVWIGLGFGKLMRNADAIIGYAHTKEVKDSHLTGRLLSSVQTDAEQNIHHAQIDVDENMTVLVFERALKTSDESDFTIDPNADIDIIWAIGDGDRFSFHGEYGAQKLNFSAGTQYTRDIPLLLLVHAALMVLAWAVMSPAIITITRYFKVTPGQAFPKKLDNKFWWITHWLGHSVVIATSLIAFVLSLMSLNGLDTSTIHAKIGLVAICLSLIQAFYGWARGTKGGPVDDDGNPVPSNKVFGDHYNMTIYRRVFEWLHKSLGYLLLAASHVAIYSGFFLFELGAWAYVAMLVSELVMFAFYLFFSLQHRWVDTYHAIWGFSRRHPGNKYSKSPYKDVDHK
ncbi:ferric reductase [Enterovibrio norvegicus]|uniref:cytochrome and DOMON domain-containing protein n=1 Tax=Enterovibrio norvegicus TaxID=188144 RepID=UPI003D0B1271